MNIVKNIGTLFVMLRIPNAKRINKMELTKPRERVEVVDKNTRKKWLFEKVDRNLTLDQIEAGTGIDKRTIGKAFTDGLATPTTKQKLNEFFKAAA